MIIHSLRIEIDEWFKEAVNAGSRRFMAARELGLSLRTLQRYYAHNEPIKPDQRPLVKRPIPANKLSDLENQMILKVCNTAEYENLPPSQIVPKLADQGIYLGSESSFYRILRANQQLTHRGHSQERKKRAISSHIATAPNQVWMWDITYLPSKTKGKYFYLYQVEDLFSRFGIAFEVHESESAEHASKLMSQAVFREQCHLKPPILHSDNGSVMKSYTLNAKLESLGIMRSHSRPRVSNDNQYIESFFRTLKYCPKYPSKGFDNLADARAWVAEFMQFYNHEHRHSKIKFVTPAQRHRQEDAKLLKARKNVYEQAKMLHPERWSGKTRNWDYQNMVTLNPLSTREIEAYKIA
jgi:putative transposase